MNRLPLRTNRIALVSLEFMNASYSSPGMENSI